MTLAQTLNPYFQERTARHQFSGIISITQGADALYSGAFGYANRDWNIENALNVRFDTASITKLFTAVATLQLIEQGRLTFDTRVIPFLGLGDTTISPDVTVFHLLTHTSGIGDDAEEEAGESYEALFVHKPNYSIQTTADFLPQFMHKPANFPPGQGCRYCNVSYVLLGLVIEKVLPVMTRFLMMPDA
jgi:CubicO group peptidase (beta-lactamase class C family)